MPSTADNALPGPGQRLRCAACGNLTRFDVIVRRRTAAYWHYSVAGDLKVETERDLAADAELVRCRWCGSDRDVHVVPTLSAGHPGARVRIEPGTEPGPTGQ